MESTILLLDALEYNGHDLIYIPQGGNWADEYPYEGYVLYDQILRSWGLRLLGKHFKNVEIKDLHKHVLACEVNDTAKAYLESLQKVSKQEYCIQLMSLPEYQMC